MVTQEALKEKALLSYQQGGSDKVYIVELKEQTLKSGLKGYIVHCHYGRRGSTMNFANKTPSPVGSNEAKQIFNKVVKEKTAKGYRVDSQHHTPHAQPSPAQQPQNPGVPFGLLPQLLNPVKSDDELEALLADDEWCLQEKMDGERRLVSKVNGEWIGGNKKGMIVSLPFLLVNALSNGGVPDDVVLDGEIIGDVYYVFDVVRWNEPLIDFPWSTRREYLHEVEKAAGAEDLIRVVQFHLGGAAKRAFFEHAKAVRLEGVVFKHDGGDYSAGRPNSGGDQLKYKFVESATVVVSRVNQGKRSVAIGAFDDGRVYHELGNVTIPPNQEIPEKGSFIEVRYLYAYKGGSLYQPVYLGKRSDQLLEDCTLAQLKYKSVLETIPVESSHDSRWAW